MRISALLMIDDSQWDKREWVRCTLVHCELTRIGEELKWQQMDIMSLDLYAPTFSEVAQKFRERTLYEDFPVINRVIYREGSGLETTPYIDGDLENLIRLDDL